MSVKATTEASNSASRWLPDPARWLLLGGMFLGGGVGGLAEHVSNAGGGGLSIAGGLITGATVFYPAAASAKWVAGVAGVVMIAIGCGYLFLSVHPI